MPVCIVPAAGASERMGQSKALLPWQGSTVVGSLISTLVAGGVDRVRVVIRPGDDELASEVEAHPSARVVTNHEPELGMLSSILAGVRVEPLGDGSRTGPLLVCPVDHPLLAVATVAELLRTSAASPGRILVPTHRGRRGHPLVVPQRFVDELPRLDRGRGLRALLENQRHAVVEVPIADAGIVADLNTPDDYARALS